VLSCYAGSIARRWKRAAGNSLGAPRRHIHHGALQVDPAHTQIRAQPGDLHREPPAAAARVQQGAAGRRGRRHVLGDPPVHAPEHRAGVPIVGLLVELLASGEATQQQVADRLSLDKSRVSRLCSALERKDLLARQRDESNRRNLRVRLTASGASAATRLGQTWHERHEQMLAAMTPDERRALLLGLSALARELAAFHSEHQTVRESLAT